MLTAAVVCAAVVCQHWDSTIMGFACLLLTFQWLLQKLFLSTRGGLSAKGQAVHRHQRGTGEVQASPPSLPGCSGSILTHPTMGRQRVSLQQRRSSLAGRPGACRAGRGLHWIRVKSHLTVVNHGQDKSLGCTARTVLVGSNHPACGFTCMQSRINFTFPHIQCC